MQPVLFLVYISPLAVELLAYSPVLCGVRIPPQLFSDDCTLVHTTPQGLLDLLKLVSAWSDRWGMEVNMRKTSILLRMPDQSIGQSLEQ